MARVRIIIQVAVLPASPAEVERVFATMNRIKSPLRNRLVTTALDNLIRIFMAGPDVANWDPVPAALR